MMIIISQKMIIIIVTAVETSNLTYDTYIAGNSFLPMLWWNSDLEIYIYMVNMKIQAYAKTYVVAFHLTTPHKVNPITGQ
jgi:hypothetical protein